MYFTNTTVLLVFFNYKLSACFVASVSRRNKTLWVILGDVVDSRKFAKIALDRGDIAAAISGNWS